MNLQWLLCFLNNCSINNIIRNINESNKHSKIRGSRAGYFCSAMTCCSTALIGISRTLWLACLSPSLLSPRCCTGSSSWEPTRSSPSCGAGTKIGILPGRADGPLRLARDHWYGWSLELPLYRRSTLLLCYLAPKPRCSMDQTTSNHRKTLNIIAITLVRNLHFAVDGSHLVDSFYLWR